MISQSDALLIREQIYAQLAELVTLLTSLRAARRAQADGYPRRSSSEGAAATPATPTAHADPTAQAVIARNEGHSGQIARAERVVERAFIDTRRLCESAIGGARNALEPPKEPPPPPREAMCRCCDNAVQATESQITQRAKRWGADHKHPELCDWCATFVHHHGRRPPKSLLQKRESGKRIYDKDVREALSGRTS